MALICLGLAPEANADTANLIPSADTSLFAHDPDNNLGSSDSVAAGTTAGLGAAAAKSRALFKFDVASKVPTNALISSVRLTLRVTKAPTPRVNSTFDLRKVLVSWGEGKKSGATGGRATVGEATWKLRSTGSATVPAVAWSAPGGVAGTDFSGAVSSSTQVLGTGAFVFPSSASMVADVQAWLQDTNSNFGWCLVSESESSARTARRFGSREAAAASRPTLEIVYTLPTPPPPPVLAEVSATGNTFKFTFSAQAGNSYAVEFRDAVPPGPWSALTTIEAKTSSFTATVSDPITSPQRFYRVNASPIR